MTRPQLIVLAGLPGSGKSTIADGLSRAFSIPVFSVDPIEAAMWRGGISEEQTGIAAYEVAAALADEQLRLGHSIIVDAVNPVEASRVVWRRLAGAHRARLTIIECICSDETIHRQRVEQRVRNIQGMRELRWDRVLERRKEYQPWTDPRLILDTSIDGPETLLAKAARHLHAETN